MSNPIIDYEIGKMNHREYEARACGCWNQMTNKSKWKTKHARHIIYRKLSKFKNAFTPNGYV